MSHFYTMVSVECRVFLSGESLTAETPASVDQFLLNNEDRQVHRVLCAGAKSVADITFIMLRYQDDAM